MTIQQSYIHYRRQLEKIYDKAEVLTITEMVHEFVTGLPKWKLRNNNNDLTEEQEKDLHEKLSTLLLYTPVQYLLGECWFYKRKYLVNNSVLIPRPETEELVEWIVEYLKTSGKKNKILEIGSGSGCIAISLKLEAPISKITAVEISKDAINTAKKNAEALNADVKFIHLDFLKEQENTSLDMFDVIVSNPPYIPKEQAKNMHKNVLDHEPHISLFVEDDDPLIFYRSIAEFAKTHLYPGGNIFVETNEKYANEVKNLFESFGFTSGVKKDLFGNGRMVRAKFI